MTSAPERLIQMVKDISRAISRGGVQHAVAGGMTVSAHGHPRATKGVDFLIDSRAVSASSPASMVAARREGRRPVFRKARRTFMGNLGTP